MEKKGTTEIIHGKETFTWEIRNFTLECKPKGSALRSPSFSIGPNDYSTWYLLLYPKGENDSRSTQVTIRIALEQSKCIPICAQVCLSAQSGSHKKFGYAKIYTFTTIDEGYGNPFFFDTNRYASDSQFIDYLKDADKLTIICRMTVFMDVNSITLPTVETVIRENSLSRDFETLWTSENLSDFTIIADGKRFPVHKLILSARSPVFAATINCDMKEKNENTVEIKDVDHQVVKEMLRFIYTGKVENLDVVAFELFKLSDRYQLDELKEICGDMLFEEIASDNAVEILILAELRQIKRLKDRAIDFIVCNIKMFIDTDKFKSLQTSPNYSSLYNEIFRTLALKQIGS